MYMIFDGFLKWGIPKTHIFNTKVTKRYTKMDNCGWFAGGNLVFPVGRYQGTA